MNDGSDDEAERKGGHIDIPEWVRSVNEHIGNFEKLLASTGYPLDITRYTS